MTKRRPVKRRTSDQTSGAHRATHLTAPSADEAVFFDSTTSRCIVFLILLVTALLLRLHRIQKPPLDYHATRQYRSALIARAFYYRTSAALSDAGTRASLEAAERQGILEPPVSEWLACLAYHVAGGEHLWIPRTLCSAAWLVGGGFLYWLARRITSTDGALFSTALYLLLPFSIRSSKCFQPDPIMVMLLVMSLVAVCRYYEQESTRRLLLASAVSGLAIFVKPFAAFFIFSSFMSLAISARGLRLAFWSRGPLYFLPASLLPTLLYFSYGVFASDSLARQIGGTLLPHLLLQSFFWDGWLLIVHNVVGHVAVIVTLLSIPLIPRGQPRGLLAGLLIGYFAFSLFCSYHTPTHDYYQLPLIPIVALGTGPLTALLMSRISSVSAAWSYRLAVYAIMLMALVINVRIYSSQCSTTDYTTVVEEWQEIGRAVSHSDKTIWLAPYYGKPLQYYGQIAGANWPSRADLDKEALVGRRETSVAERFLSLREETGADFFIADIAGFGPQRDLAEFLSSNFPIFNRTEHYAIYDLRNE